MDRPYQYRPVRFFVATTVASWIPWFIGVWAGRGGQAEIASLWNLLGLLAPLVVGLVMILGSGNRALKADLWDRLTSLRRIRPGHLLPALLLPGAVMALSLLISLGLGQSRDQLRLASGQGFGALVVIALILAPIIEEAGWRGYGVDSLRSRMGTLPTTLWFGVLWSLWHAPLVLIPGSYQYELAHLANPLYLVNFFVGVVPAAVIANWVYYRNDRSIIANVLFHSMINTVSVLPNASQPTKVLVSVFYLVIAIAVLVFDRETFSAGPRNFVAERETTGGAPRARPVAAVGA
jgi:membrane protease YdiL (CAAX protease family)